ncbi:MAG: HIT family protein [archaeon]
MSDCIFCKIVEGSISCTKVYEDDEVLAFLDVAPLAKGHCLVVPKKHFEFICEVSDIGQVALAVQKIAKVLGELNDGVNVLQNNGRSAGQVVPHVHFHLIPRNEGDNVNLGLWNIVEYAEGEAFSLAEKIKSLLNKA